MTAEKELVRLSPSVAKAMLARNPKHGWLRHRLLGNVQKTATSAMIDGKIYEALVTGDTDGRLVIVDAANYQTNKAKEARDKAEKEDKLPILAAKLDGYNHNAMLFIEQLERRGIHFDGILQKRFEWNHNGVPCSGVTDHINPKTGQIDEIKVTSDASESAIVMMMANHYYAMQGESYREAFAEEYPDMAGRQKVRFIFLEPDPIPQVQIVEPAGSMRQLGQMQWDRACAMWGECLKNNDWPGYPEQVLSVEAPAWRLSSEEQLKWETEMSNLEGS